MLNVRSVRQVPYALIVLLLAGVLGGTLAACGGGGSSSDSTERGMARSAAAPAATQGGAEAQRKGAPGTSGSGRNGSGGAAAQPLPPAGRAVVYTATMRIRAKDVDASATRAKQLVSAAGGYVEHESGSSDPPGSTITLKIPSDRYPGVLDQLSRQLGTKLSVSQQADDVTGEVADVDSRVRSAKAALASFRKLLDKATTVGEIIDVEQEIASREADLESLQARQKALGQSTQYATVTVTLEAAATPARHHGDRGGFVGALGDGWHAFTGFLGGVAVVFGWLLPFLVTAAIIVAPVVAYRNRRRGRGPAEPDTGEGREEQPVAVGTGGASGAGTGDPAAEPVRPETPPAE
ncbi:DUF4349 domain-containing protein [Actinomadura nitritigenes]|uniref:DUF4349 domain-containing protein n=1 Tax=Actinomadura nitritigenes TaxID=134602 RepID=A0ABS3QQN8_9ACTN|nr:DUF4349 domain-containing protein [Actinomadura nitritigenes]MBO2436293.1 DUF4349 domain-containing protein [Actinomadura nitritigenes]